MDKLPIADVLPDLIAALERDGRAVLQAPPGAGKTTGVPPALLESGLVKGRIIMLEPRRLAARGAAERMAQQLGEAVGQTVGYRIRGEAVTSKQTRIEVVTEGILTAMLQTNPELPGIGAVIFDEFHERSLNADLGLALTWEARTALRDDLVLLVMSATLDAEPVAALMDNAPVITSEGRAFPVATRWLPRPLPTQARIENEVARAVHQALEDTEGGILAFLPGAREIGRVASLLGELEGGIALHQLYGAANAKAQRAAVAPQPERKVVLATSIAETSLTIPGIRVVIDSGLARRARFDPGSGMQRLVTERASKAEADQRRGRAGREATGIAYRLWAKPEEGAMPAFAPPEIVTADLAGFTLELAAWGAGIEDLALLTLPPDGALKEARELLHSLGAMDAGGAITSLGRKMARLPLHPRLAHMLLRAGAQAAPLAAILSEGDPLRSSGAPVDIDLRLKALAGSKDYSANPAVLSRCRNEAKRLTKLVDAKEPRLTTGQMAALAYPDRIGKRRSGTEPRWQLSGGSGAKMDPGQGLAQAAMLVCLDSDGDRREARIRLAADATEADIRDVFAAFIVSEDVCVWSRRDGQVIAESREMLFDLTLGRKRSKSPDPDALARAMGTGLKDRGLETLKFPKSVERLRLRVMFARENGLDLPDFSDAGLLASLEDWFTPLVGTARKLEDLRDRDWKGTFLAQIDWPMRQALDAHAPEHFQTPLGRSVPIAYEPEGPKASVRLQELFGVAEHPMSVGRPIILELLSPAQRPLQVTADLPGFWQSSYADVRRDMRGRYPKHPWPEDPLQADPTVRAKPRRTP